MRLTDHWRSTTVRLLLVYGAFFTVWSVLLIGLIEWDTSRLLSTRGVQTLKLRSSFLTGIERAELPEALDMVVAIDRKDTMFCGLFDADGGHLAGNLVQIPRGVAADGIVRTLHDTVMRDGMPQESTTHTLATRRPDGTVLVVQRVASLVDEVEDILQRSLMLGLSLILIPGIFGGYLLSRGPLKRLHAIEAAVQPIMRGDLKQRLPLSPRKDELDLLAGIVNLMLGEIERLMSEVKGVCDSIAHDLRTPLTRLRAQLHRVHQGAGADQQAMLEQCIADADGLLVRFRALLRISEIEDMQRRAGFGLVDLAPTARQIHEFYAPLAEDRGIRFDVEIPPKLPAVHADPHLIFEALSNLVDNAIKFTPAQGRVRLRVTVLDGAPSFEVDDSGPGIANDERRAILLRFQRGAATRDLPGHGLGLAIVAAIVHLHGFAVTIGDGDFGGARMTLGCRRPADTSGPTS